MRSPETPGIVITRCKGNRATKTKYSPVAQLAEHSTVNRRVTGSSPVGGADIARTPERSSGVLAIYVPLARTSNPSGLRPRRGKDFWFLARSENLRLAGSSPVGTFPLSREPVTTPPYVSAGAPTPNPSGLRPRRDNGFLLPRALGKTVTPLCRVQRNSGIRGG